MFLDQSIAAGEEEEANAIRKELWEIRYGGKSEVPDTPADGYLALWMALEFNEKSHPADCSVLKAPAGKL